MKDPLMWAHEVKCLDVCGRTWKPHCGLNGRCPKLECRGVYDIAGYWDENERYRVITWQQGSDRYSS